jgi:hypothetical protein
MSTPTKSYGDGYKDGFRAALDALWATGADLLSAAIAEAREDSYWWPEEDIEGTVP